MGSIAEFILKVPSSRVALINRDEKYTYEDLFYLIVSNKEVIHSLKGASVAIVGKDRFEFSLLLILLDGKAGSILFLPKDIDQSLYEQYFKEAKVNYEVFLDGNTLKCNSLTHLVIDKYSSESSETNWIIPTSGTTNIPKLVSHSFESLTRTTKLNLEAGESFCWGLVFDIYRFSGIQVFLQSILSGSTLVITESYQSMSGILAQFSKHGVNALSGTPSFWRKVLMSENADTLKLVRITLGGEISDNVILKALAKMYPRSKILHIYASTEVGVGFSVSDGEAGFPSSFLNSEVNKIKLKIDDEGMLWIAPLGKNQKYISSESMYDKEGYINTGDLVKLENDRVYFLGRESGSINVGGNKVQPEEVEKELMATGLVNEAYVYAIKNPMMGSLVCADVTLKQKDVDKKKVRKDILLHCRNTLDSFKVPAVIKFVSELNTTQSGKLKRD